MGCILERGLVAMLYTKALQEFYEHQDKKTMVFIRVRLQHVTLMRRLGQETLNRVKKNKALRDRIART